MGSTGERRGDSVLGAGEQLMWRPGGQGAGNWRGLCAGGGGGGRGSSSLGRGCSMVPPVTLGGLLGCTERAASCSGNQMAVTLLLPSSLLAM